MASCVFGEIVAGSDYGSRSFPVFDGVSSIHQIFATENIRRVKDLPFSHLERTPVLNKLTWVGQDQIILQTGSMS